MGRYQWGDSMQIGCDTFLKALEQWAPLHYAEEWDNCGLQIGRRNKALQKVMVALTPGEAAIQAAVDATVDLLLTHHPMIFKPTKSVTTDTVLGQSIIKLIQNDINLYCAHTNLDIAGGGVNDVLAQALELQQVEPLADITREVCYKVVVYVPVGHEDAVRTAMCAAGAGCIGNYSDCTFQTKGTGTFLAQEGTNPFLGEQGMLEYAEEYRLETIVPQSMLTKVIQAMEKVHPYEEVAYDVFRLEQGGAARGIGRIGVLENAMPMEAFLAFVAKQLECTHLSYAGKQPKSVQKVALCGGSGISYLKAAKKAGADVYVTGDMKYHDAQLAEELGICVVDAGHFGTEKLIVKALASFAETQGLKVVVFEEKDYLQHWHE